jgi:hypothetical protein
MIFFKVSEIKKKIEFEFEIKKIFKKKVKFSNCASIWRY